MYFQNVFSYNLQLMTYSILLLNYALYKALALALWYCVYCLPLFFSETGARHTALAPVSNQPAREPVARRRNQPITWTYFWKTHFSKCLCLCIIVHKFEKYKVCVKLCLCFYFWIFRQIQRKILGSFSVSYYFKLVLIGCALLLWHRHDGKTIQCLNYR